MKLKSVYLVPMIGLGWFDELINIFGKKLKIRHIIILFVKIELTKEF